MTKFIVVAGGVMSGVGKASQQLLLTRILREYGYTVTDHTK